MKCINCEEEIGQERLEALVILEKQPHEFTCIKCAPNNFKKALWAGESGSSPLIIADSLGREGVERLG